MRWAGGLSPSATACCGSIQRTDCGTKAGGSTSRGTGRLRHQSNPDDCDVGRCDAAGPRGGVLGPLGHDDLAGRAAGVPHRAGAGRLLHSLQSQDLPRHARDVRPQHGGRYHLACGLPQKPGRTGARGWQAIPTGPWQQLAGACGLATPRGDAAPRLHAAPHDFCRRADHRPCLRRPRGHQGGRGQGREDVARRHQQGRALELPAHWLHHERPFRPALGHVREPDWASRRAFLPSIQSSWGCALAR